jgi:hypothetical protein
MGYTSARYGLPFNIIQTVALVEQLAGVATGLTV